MKILDVAIERLRRPLTALEKRQLRKIWDSIPHVRCQGLCQEYCTNAPITPVEAYFLIEKHGATIQPKEHGQQGTTLPTLGANGPCEFLRDGRCSIYDDRPMVCRAFGHPVATLPCPHGCIVKRPMTNPMQLAWLMRDLARVLSPELSDSNEFYETALAMDAIVKQTDEMMLIVMTDEEAESAGVKEETAG